MVEILLLSAFVVFLRFKAFNPKELSVDCAQSGYKANKVTNRCFRSFQAYVRNGNIFLPKFVLRNSVGERLLFKYRYTSV